MTRKITSHLRRHATERHNVQLSRASQPVLRYSATPQNIMKDHLRKPFGFLDSMNSTRPRSRDSTSIACPKDAIQKGCHSRLQNRGEGDLNNQTHFTNNIMPRRQKSQPVIRDRKVIESEPRSGHRYNFRPVFRNSSAMFDRTTQLGR